MMVIANLQLIDSDSLASLTIGASAMIKSGAASAKESVSKFDLLTTLTPLPKRDNLQSNDGIVKVGDYALQFVVGLS